MICFYFYIQCREATILHPPQHENEFPFALFYEKEISLRSGHLHIPGKKVGDVEMGQSRRGSS